MSRIQPSTVLRYAALTVGAAIMITPFLYMVSTSFKPQAFVRGTKMAFAGLPKAQERADVIAYLRTMNDNPPPLPK